VVNQRCDALGQAEDLGARLPGQAFNLLIGWPVQSLEEAVAEARAVTHGDVVRVAATAYADGLLMTPSGTTAEWAGYTAAPTSSDHPVQGQAYPCIEDPQTRLILGDHGVSVADEDQTATVRFDGCAVALAWPDGARQLIGRDGIVVRVEPTMYAGVPAAVHWLDAKIPHSLRVDMPARDPSRIPTPELPTWPTAQTGAARPGRAGPILTLIALGPVALFSSFLALLLGLSILTDKTDLGVTIGLTVFFTLVTAAAVWGLTWSIRRLAKR
jgi:hypothetical protein